jgi:hypothetical protein
MDSSSGFLIFIIFLGLFIVWPTIVSHRQGKLRKQETTWFWGFFLGWIGVLIMSAQPKPVEYKLNLGPETTASSNKKCPDCAEYVPTEAQVCKFCSHRFKSL